MSLRQRTLSASSGTWVVAQESGWLPYAESLLWTLSAGDGVKYLGVWLADAAWNVSALNPKSLAFTNLLESSQSLADGERIQYRFPMHYGTEAHFHLFAHEGNPDVYVWRPRSGFRPHYAATGTAPVEVLGFRGAEEGLYLVEVKAEGDSVYHLQLDGDIVPREAATAAIRASRPQHPLTVSDPLSAGAAVAPAPPTYKLYLPVVMKGS